MIKHIRNYILENKRVTIRGLGTLELRFREAEIHPICQDFAPPGKYLSFSAGENEGGDDFSVYVAEKAKVSLENARQLLEQWVETVNAALQSDGKYELDGMGCFVRGNVGLDFEPALDPELSADSFGLPAFSLREERTTLFGQKEENAPQAEPVQIITEEAKMESKETVEESKEKMAEDVAEESEKREEAEKETTEETVQTEVKEDSTSQPEKPQKHVGRIIFYVLLILLLCVIIAAGVYAILRPDDFVQKKDYCISRVTSLFSKDTAAEDAAFPEEMEADDWFVDADDEMTDDELRLEETVVEEAAAVENAPAAPAAASSARCYVIVGGFGNAANADNLVRSLKSKYPNACNLGLNAKGTLTMVGIGPYTRAEAESKADALSVTYKDCWIFEK